MATDRSAAIDCLKQRAPQSRVWLDRLDRTRLAVCVVVLLLTFWLAPGGRRAIDGADED